MMSNSEARKRAQEQVASVRGDEVGVEGLRERDTRLYAWLANVKPGDIVTVRLNSTDTLAGKVYEAPDARGTSLCVWTTVLRYGNGYPGPSYEPVDVAAHDAEQRRLGAEAVVAAAVRDIRARFGRDSDYDDGLEDAPEILHAARAAAQQVSER